jgi:hypothetical protein
MRIQTTGQEALFAEFCAQLLQNSLALCRQSL